MGKFNLFIKLVREEYKLEDDELERLRQRLLADDREFERVWRTFHNKAAFFSGGVDHFRSVLHDLLT